MKSWSDALELKYPRREEEREDIRLEYQHFKWRTSDVVSVKNCIIIYTSSNKKIYKIWVNIH